jgi:hypothetical protein
MSEAKALANWEESIYKGELGPGEDSGGSGDARVASAVRNKPPILVGMPEKMVNNSYALFFLSLLDRRDRQHPALGSQLQQVSAVESAAQRRIIIDRWCFPAGTALREGATG